MPAPSRSTAAPTGRRPLLLALSLALSLALPFALLLASCGGPAPGDGEVDLRPPEAVTATAGPGRIEITWIDTSRNEEGFQIYREAAAGLTATGSRIGAQDFRIVGSTPPDATSYTDTEVETGTAYRYQVAAVGPDGTVGPRSEQDGPAVAPRSSVQIDVTVEGDGRVVGPGGFECSARCTLDADAGTPVTIEAVAGASEGFAGWGGACADAAGALRCTFTPDDDTAVSAAFATYVLRLELEGDGEGVFEIFDPQTGTFTDCRRDCAVVFDAPIDTSITYLRGDSEGTELGPWSGACDGADLNNYCLVRVDGPTTVGKTWLRPPRAVDDSYTLDEDTTLDPDAANGILANDEDTPSDTLSATLVDGVEHGTLELDPDGSFRYAPDANYNGDDAFTYRVEDAYGNTSQTGRVDLSITPVDDAPVALDREVSTAEDLAVSITLRGSDVDGDALSYEVTSQPANGALTGTADGDAAVEYTPDLDFNGTDSFTYRVTAGGKSDSATVTIIVSQVGDEPIALSDTYEVAEDTPLDATTSVLANDVDGDGDPLTAQLVDDVANGRLTLDSDGTFSYTPAPNFNGSDEFTYRASDGEFTSGITTVTIDVTPVNDPPTAEDATRSVQEDDSVAIDLAALSGDVDAGDEAQLAFAIAEAPTNGTLSEPADGSVTYTPDPDFNGTDSFTFEVEDPAGATATATVTINVIPVDDPPVANDVSAETEEDTAVTITLEGSDIDSTELVYQIVGDPANGTLTGTGDNDANVTYTPDPDFVGTDSFTYRVVADEGSDTATVTVTVTPVDDPPVATDVTAETPEDTPVGITLDGSDPDGDSLAYTVTDGPDNGSLTNAGDGDANVTYTPDPDFNGTDTFTYQVAANGKTDTATVTVDVIAVDDPPVAEDVDVETEEDTPVDITLRGSDVDSTGLAYTITDPPDNGTLAGTNNTDAEVTYTPDPDFSGSDSFTYQVAAGGKTDTATVTVTVTAVNDPPVANDDTYEVAEDTPLDAATSVLANDVDGDGDPLTAQLVDDVANGQLTLDSDGTFSYTPAPNFNGSDEFTYRANDGDATSEPATVTITVTPVDDAPVATDVSAETEEDTPVGITLQGSDIDSTGLAYTITGQPSEGTLTGTDDTDAEVTYTPDPDFNGSDSFTYQVAAGGKSDTATVTITVTAVVDGPTANDIGAATLEDTPVTITLDGSDPDGTELVYAIVKEPDDGALANHTDGNDTLSYSPDENFAGGDSFRYRVTDADDATDDATVTVEVTPVNDPPSFEIPSPELRIPVGTTGPQSRNGFADAIGPGGGSDEDGQSLAFDLTRLSSDLPSLSFSQPPAIDPNGRLSFDSEGVGRARFQAVLTDDGGTANGGDDTSSPVDFTIVVDPELAVAFDLEGVGSGTVAVSASDAPNYSCTSNCTEVLPLGSDATLTATADADSVFAGWSGDGSGSSPRSVTMTENRSVTARFVPREFILDVSVAAGGTVTSSPAGIDCGSDCSASYAIGTSVALSATPAPGYRFAGWSGDGSGTSPRTVAMNGDRSVEATFTEQHTVTVSPEPANGTVASGAGDGLNCGSGGNDCTLTVDTGTGIQLTATAEANYSFTGWTGDATGTANPLSLTVGSDLTVGAAFAVDTFALTTTSRGTGSGTVTSSPAGIDCGSDCSETYAYDTDVDLTADPDPDSDFTGWSGDCSGTGTCTVDMTQERAVAADFTLKTAVLTVTVDGAGTVTSGDGLIACEPGCSQTYDYGQTVTLTATPALDSAFTGWSGACNGAGTCNVTIDGTDDVTATFTASL